MVYTAHTKESIVRAIGKAYEYRDQLREDIVTWKQTAIAENDQKIEALRARIDRLGRQGVS